MPVYDVFGRKKNEILKDTWGHLAGTPGKKYHGWILVYYSTYGDYGILDWEFDGLPFSPWQHEHFDAWVDQWINELLITSNSYDAQGKIYLYKGWYKPGKIGHGARFEKTPFVPVELPNIP